MKKQLFGESMDEVVAKKSQHLYQCVIQCMAKLVSSIFQVFHTNILIKPLVNRLLSKNDSIKEVCHLTIEEMLSSHNPALRTD